MELVECLVYALEATAAVPIGDLANSLFYNKFCLYLLKKLGLKSAFFLFFKIGF